VLAIGGAGEVVAELVVGVVVEPPDGGVLDGAVLAFDLAIGPMDALACKNHALSSIKKRDPAQSTIPGIAYFFIPACARSSSRSMASTTNATSPSMT
jgi:hypothetical protein